MSRNEGLKRARAQQRPDAFSANGGNGSRLSLRAEVAAKVRALQKQAQRQPSQRQKGCQVEQQETGVRSGGGSRSLEQQEEPKREHIPPRWTSFSFPLDFVIHWCAGANWRNWDPTAGPRERGLRARRGSEASYASQ